MPSPSVSTFTFPSTTEPVFTASTSEPVFESPNHSQTSQTTQSQQLQQYHTTTVSNNNAKFPYLKKEEYETWAMKMEYWIMNSDHNLWNIVLNGNSRKRIILMLISCFYWLIHVKRLQPLILCWPMVYLECQLGLGGFVKVGEGRCDVFGSL
ncbi:hypothetical protein Tco_0765985 [Tanacetum coccineum]